jgi:hypothetical protein
MKNQPVINEKTLKNIDALFNNNGETGPVKRVQQICKLMRRYPRSVVVGVCEEKGINTHTARTQYQKWYATHKR